MNLVIDIGNSTTKMAIFEGQQLQDFVRTEGVDFIRILHFSESFQSIRACIISSVSTDVTGLVRIIDKRYPCIPLSHTTPIPFKNLYRSPATLGKDRLAGMASAAQLFPQEDVLVIDAGTAVTYDLMTSDGCYQGGSISPGILMRYKALHTFTERLPLLSPEGQPELTGRDTAGSIHSGVINGLVSEVEGIVNEYLRVFPRLKIILTGGDHNYFDKRLKVKTFAAPNLVLEGLNIILNYNLEKIQQ